MRNFKVSSTWLSGLAFLASGLIVPSGIVMAQDEGDEQLEEITVTGSRISSQNITAASPVMSINMDELNLKQTTNIERVFRDLPITIPGDGENVNNGTGGQSTIDLRGLGQGRSLILMDGKRVAPYDIDGIASTDVIPVNMVKRVDIVTGGASAVYGSDAMSGAVNFILRDDFEGFEIDFGWSETDSGVAVAGGGQDSTSINVLFGAAFDDGRGHVVIGGGHNERGQILLAEREYSIFGVSSTTGSGLGAPPARPASDCEGGTEHTTDPSTGVGSTTAMPGTLNLRSGHDFQFRDNGDLVLGRCAQFNFNPFNLIQTPMERWQATTIASYSFNDNVEFYGRASFSANESTFEIAPSGTFGSTFTIPVGNPFFNAAAQTLIVNDLNAGAVTAAADVQAAIAALLAQPPPLSADDMATLAALQATAAADPLGFLAVGIHDLNNDGVFDATESFTSTARRRTLELGVRSAIYDTDYFQYVVGVRGQLPGAMEAWDYDLSYSRGESDFIETRDGFTNLTNLALGINTVSATQCETIQGVVTGAPCTPINVFGPVGSITAEQREAGFFIAIASDLRKSTQTIYSGSVSGTIDALRIPLAEDGLSVAFGLEFSELTATSSPDECLKLQPASCGGGAGGFRLPIIGAYDSDEYFVEAILPIVQGRTGFENLGIEVGYRSADYDVQGSTESWKAGISWEIMPGFRLRFMEQEAVRVANVGELFQPVTTGLDNARLDPCSIGPAGYVPPVAGSELFNLCVQTGMLPGQVGTVADIIAGQINVFNGTNLLALPTPEEASTTTFGFVWEPDMFDFLTATTLSIDYYDIQINNYIAEPTGQEALDLCYVLADPTCLAGVVRSAGALGETGTGIPAFVTNFVLYEAEGIDFVLNTGFDAGNIGEFAVSLTAHQYLTNEFQTTLAQPIVDCKGRYGTSCDPVPEFRSVLRFSWFREQFDASLNWRHIGDMDAQSNEAAALFEAFRSVDAQDYIDLSFGYEYRDIGRISFLVTNAFDEDPPILGSDTGTTAFNNANTFSSLYDTVGRVYSVNLRFTF